MTAAATDGALADLTVSGAGCNPVCTLKGAGADNNMQVVIHAGVAFTDEDRLFGLLKANQETVANHNGAFFGRRAFRRHFRQALNELEPGTPALNTRKAFQGMIPKDKTVDRVVISQPGFLGAIQTSILDGQFYPLAGERIAYLDDMFDDCQMELFIGLRNPGSFIPKALMAQSEPERQRILAETDISCLSWLTMIDNIRDLAPDVQITLWSNEDSPLIWGDIARAMVELPEDTPLNEEFSFLSTLLTDEGRDEIETLIQRQPAIGSPTLRTDLGQIFARHADPTAIEEELTLPGWSDEIVAAFTELYEQDLDVLQNMQDIHFLTP